MAKFHYVLPLKRKSKTRSMVAKWGGRLPPKKHRLKAINLYDAHRGSRWYWEEPCAPYDNPAIALVLTKLRQQRLQFMEVYTETHVTIASMEANHG